MNTKIKFSIVVAVYNNTDTIERCLDSIYNQTYKNFEVILVDDCSPDVEYSYLERRYENLKLIRLSENGGPGIARQTGLDNATGDWVLFVDQDDALYHQDVLSFILDKQKEYPNAKIFQFNFVAVNSSHQEFFPPVSDMRPLHGIIFNLKFIRDNNIRFHDSLRWHEDGYFYITCKYLIRKLYENICDVFVIIPDVVYTYNNIYMGKSITHKVYGVYDFYESSIFDQIIFSSSIHDRLRDVITDNEAKDFIFTCLATFILNIIAVKKVYADTEFLRHKILRIKIFCIELFNIIFDRFRDVSTIEDMYEILKNVSERDTLKILSILSFDSYETNVIYEILNDMYEIYLQNKQSVV